MSSGSPERRVERLLREARAGDPDAARHLLSAARRAHDLHALRVAAQTLDRPLPEDRDALSWGSPEPLARYLRHARRERHLHTLRWTLRGEPRPLSDLLVDLTDGAIALHLPLGDDAVTTAPIPIEGALHRLLLRCARRAARRRTTDANDEALDALHHLLHRPDVDAARGARERLDFGLPEEAIAAHALDVHLGVEPVELNHAATTLLHTCEELAIHLGQPRLIALFFDALAEDLDSRAHELEAMSPRERLLHAAPDLIRGPEDAVHVHLLDALPTSPPDDAVERLLGSPRHRGGAPWPELEALPEVLEGFLEGCVGGDALPAASELLGEERRMDHLATLRLEPPTRPAAARDDDVAVSIFLGFVSFNEAFRPGTEHSRVLRLGPDPEPGPEVGSPPADLLSPEGEPWITRRVAPRGLRRTLARVPRDIFHDALPTTLDAELLEYASDALQRPLDEVRALALIRGALLSESFLGGAPIWLQGAPDLTPGTFVGQLGEALFDDHAGFGSGVLYVTLETAFYQC